MLEAFKLKPFDLEPIYTSWSDGPRFVGNPTKDGPVDDWLSTIKAGSVERKVPQEYWHKVGQHFMGEQAKARLDELKLVMGKVHGGKYRWNWKRYKVAMRNMCWNIDVTETEPIKVQAKKSGIWWFTRTQKKDAEVEEYVQVSPSDNKGGGAPPVPKKDESSFIRPMHIKGISDTQVVTARGTPKPPAPTRSASGDTVTTIAQAPTWLLNACSALEFLTTEHPKVMTTISAVLITVGSLPAIPAIATGAAGTVLASGAAHAVGAVAVGLGTFLKAAQDAKLKAQTEKIQDELMKVQDGAVKAIQEGLAKS